MPENLLQRARRRRLRAAHELEDVGVALLRHDRRARRHLGRQRHVRELARIEKQQVGREPAEVAEQHGDLEHERGLGLAARQLHGRDGLLRAREAERGARRFAVERQVRHAVAGGRAERVQLRARAARAAEPRDRRRARRRSRAPRARPSSASPAACACSRAARSSPCSAATRSSAATTPSRRARERRRSRRADRAAARRAPDRCASGRDGRGRRPRRCAP